MQLFRSLSTSNAVQCGRRTPRGLAATAAAAAAPAALRSTTQPAAAAASSSRRTAINTQMQRPRQLVTRAAAAAAEQVEAEQVIGPHYMEREVAETLEYAVRLCCTAEVYELHAWMLLLGVLKQEDSLAGQVLVELGLEDLYGAWHEVLWALNVIDALQPRAFRHRIAWDVRARAIAQGAVKFAGWAGRDKVASQDMLLAFAASDVLRSLFPDLDLSFDRVKRAIEKRTGEVYDLPNYEGRGSAVDSQDMFL